MRTPNRGLKQPWAMTGTLNAWEKSLLLLLVHAVHSNTERDCKESSHRILPAFPCCLSIGLRMDAGLSSIEVELKSILSRAK